jgi:hypothetical protein
VLADHRRARSAVVALATRDDGRDHDRDAAERLRARACRDDHAGDLVSEDERERVAGADAVNREADVGVAQAAAGDLDDDFAWTGVRDVAARRPERAADRDELVAVKRRQGTSRTVDERSKNRAILRGGGRKAPTGAESEVWATRHRGRA